MHFNKRNVLLFIGNNGLHVLVKWEGGFLLWWNVLLIVDTHIPTNWTVSYILPTVEKWVFICKTKVAVWNQFNKKSQNFTCEHRESLHWGLQWGTTQCLQSFIQLQKSYYIELLGTSYSHMVWLRRYFQSASRCRVISLCHIRMRSYQV